MEDFLDLTGSKPQVSIAESASFVLDKPISKVPQYDVLEKQLADASLLVNDIVLKNYLMKLTELEVVPLDNSLKQISDIRLFKITEMVYQNDEYSTYKFASVFNAVQSLNCGVFIIVDSNGLKTDFYMGVRSLDDKRTTKSLKDTLRNALCGQFPGVKTVDLLDIEAEEFLADIGAKNISSVSCVAQNKDEEFNDNKRFVQGLEKLALAMQGQRYTAVVLAKSTSPEQLIETRKAYETIYTQLSPFANMQLSYGTNIAASISDAFSHGTTSGTSHSTSESSQTGKSYSKGISENRSETKQNMGASIAKGLTLGLVTVAGAVAAPFTGGLSIAAAGGLGAAIAGIPVSSKTTGATSNENNSESSSETKSESSSINESASDTHTNTKGLSSGTTDNMQLTMQNKSLINTLERIDLQLKRIDKCESLGMWECAAYFLSDNQETAEMAAGMYKALIKGEKSGVEASAINSWGRRDTIKLPLLREYITNFIHPVFAYHTTDDFIPVSASSLVSGNELAIQMGLPRKSVCGFPVIDHAEFGKEVVKYNRDMIEHNFAIGNVFSMGRVNNTNVRLDRDSLTMHTFITGSTGSGKSNTVYEIINQLRNVYNIPFLVIEPAKGEYKNVFGQFPDVIVYGTNPKKHDTLLKINPFRFPQDIHILEHLDRLVELFNVCWPMYAAMPAILKDAMEKAYVATGWDLSASENPNGNIFPNFAELLEQIDIVIAESGYSVDSRSDYSGALCTRIRSLTNGLNRLIFCDADLTDYDLFDKNVIVDLSRVGSTETKSLIMGLLVLKLNEHRMSSGNVNNKLSHITILEEAHNLLKHTSKEQSSETSNLLGKSVEMLANSIAEMRTYGEGFIIVDQSPGLMDISVIRNTNTKIILRLPEKNDRELVGYAANLNDEQINELAKLARGVAAVYQNDWIEPVLAQINKCGIEEKNYFGGQCEINDASHLREQLIFFLIQGRVREKLDFDINVIESNLSVLNLSMRNKQFIETQIAEFKNNGKLLLWEDNYFRKLSIHLTDILGVRSRVENSTTIAVDNLDLSDKLLNIVKQFAPNANESVVITMSQCFMRDLSEGQDESEKREHIYKHWVDSIKGRGGLQ